MYNFKSTLLILLLGIVLIVPAVYCFSISLFPDINEKVVEGQSDAPQVTTVDAVSSISVSDTTNDAVSSIAVSDTTKDFSMKDDDTTNVSTTDDDLVSEVPSTDDDDTAIDPSTNVSEPPSNGTDANSWPVIMIVEDNSGLVHAKSESGSRRVDSSNNWLVVNKRTSIRKVEEQTQDFGKNRKVLSEDRNEELRIYRDNFHAVVRNGIDLTNWLRL